MKCAYMQFGQWGGPYCTRMADGLAIDERAPRNRSITGYGGARPTRYRVFYEGTWRRVYAACYSNQSSLYVRYHGCDVLVRIEVD